MRCDACNQERPVRLATFYQAVGFVLGSAISTYRGRFCDGCIDEIYRKCMWSTGLAGWWSLRGIVATLVFLPGNFAERRRVLRQPHLRPDAGDEEVEDALVQEARQVAVEAADRLTMVGIVVALGGLAIMLALKFSDAGTHYGRREDHSGDALVLFLVCLGVAAPFVIIGLQRRRRALYGPPPRIRVPPPAPAPRRSAPPPGARRPRR